MWARGVQGGEKVAWLAGFYANNVVQSPTYTLTTQWQQYTVDLTGHDLTNVAGAFGFAVDGDERQLAGALIGVRPELEVADGDRHDVGQALVLRAGRELPDVRLAGVVNHPVD